MPQPVTTLPRVPAGGVPPIVGPMQAPPTDWDALLPEAAGNRLRALRERADMAHRTIPAFSELQEASIARMNADNRLKQLLGHASLGGYALPVDDLRCVVQQRLVAQLTADQKRLQDMIDARTLAWRAASAALSSVEAWLGAGRPHKESRGDS